MTECKDVEIVVVHPAGKGTCILTAPYKEDEEFKVTNSKENTIVNIDNIEQWKTRILYFV